MSHSCKFQNSVGIATCLPSSMNIPDGFGQVILVSGNHDGLVV